jgi:hypothetical protein
MSSSLKESQDENCSLFIQKSVLTFGEQYIINRLALGGTNKKGSISFFWLENWET